MTLKNLTFRKFDLSDQMADDAAQRIVLVAGGAGFIGSNLTRRLLEQSNKVVCIDNMSTGRLENINSLLTDPSFRFIRHDIIEPFTIDGRLDRIYNLACPASPPKYQADPLQTFKTSVYGALNLLELAGAKGARVLQSSTSEVYGDPEISPQSESYRGSVNTVGPRACYDEGKRAAETLFYEMHRHEHVDTRIARIFNTYGPRMDPEDGRVVSNFIVQALTNQPLTVYGDGTQTRSFCYITDLLDGLMALMEAPEADRTIFDPVNLGNPSEFTMLALAELVQEKTGANIPIEFRPLPQDDPLQRRPDIARAGALLGWSPKVPLEAGLEPTIEYFRSELARRQSAQPYEASHEPV